MASIFSGLKDSFKRNVSEIREKRQANALEQEQYQTETRKEQGRYTNSELRQRAIDHQKEKAFDTINNPKAPLGHKVKAINEYYKDHDTPKMSNSLQELSDRAYINRYKRDRNMEKVKAIRQAVLDERARKQAVNDYKRESKNNIGYENAIKKVMNQNNRNGGLR